MVGSLKRLTENKITLKARPRTSKLSAARRLNCLVDFVPCDKFALNFYNETEAEVESQLKFWIEHHLFLA